jgi:hypothetical protein
VPRDSLQTWIAAISGVIFAAPNVPGIGIAVSCVSGPSSTEPGAQIVDNAAPFGEAEHRRTTEYKNFTYEGLIARAETEIAWGRRGLELISLEPGS